MKTKAILIIILFFTIYFSYPYAFNSSAINNNRESFEIFRFMDSADKIFKIWKITDVGICEELEFEFEQGYSGHLGRGSTEPILSKNKSKIAFVLNRDLHIYNLLDKSVEKITLFASEQDSLFQPFTVLISDFSKDDNLLLFYLTSFDDDDNPKPNKQMDYGFHLYNFLTHEISSIDIPGEFVSWLDYETVLVNIRDKNRTSEIRKYNIYSRNFENILFSKNSLWQISFNNNSIISCISLNIKAKKKEIIKYDLSNDKIDTVYYSNEFKDIESPRFSPNGKYLSYIKVDYTQGVRDSEMFYPVVDGVTIDAYKNRLRNVWITDEIIAVKFLSEILLYNKKEQKIIFNKKF